MRFQPMETFRILCFSGNMLIDSKEYQAANVVECLKAVRDYDCPRIEIWSGSDRVAILREAVPPRPERPVRPSR
jgi:hypothetical protein